MVSRWTSVCLSATDFLYRATNHESGVAREICPRLSPNWRSTSSCFQIGRPSLDRPISDWFSISGSKSWVRRRSGDMPAIVTQLSIDKLMLSDRPTDARSSADQRQVFSIGQQIIRRLSGDMPAIVTQLSIDKLIVSDSPTVVRSSADQRQIFSIGQQIMSKRRSGDMPAIVTQLSIDKLMLYFASG